MALYCSHTETIRRQDKSGGCGVCGSLVVELLPPVTFRLRQKSSKTRFKLVDVLAVDFDNVDTTGRRQEARGGRKTLIRKATQQSLGPRLRQAHLAAPILDDRPTRPGGS